MEDIEPDIEETDVVPEDERLDWPRYAALHLSRYPEDLECVETITQFYRFELEIRNENVRMEYCGMRIRRMMVVEEPAGDAGWVPWAGGKQPVDDDVKVEVEYSSGTISSGFGDDYRWEHRGNSYDIIAYRIVEPKEHAELSMFNFLP